MSPATIRNNSCIHRKIAIEHSKTAIDKQAQTDIFEKLEHSAPLRRILPSYSFVLA
ncbi:MAG: hypothetical protein K2N12_08765 [Helicobacter sp.]|nr:hypothetical protein [Helicobacter sp.]